LALGPITAVGGMFACGPPVPESDIKPRPNITILFTLVAVGVAFAWLGVEDSSKWQISIVLYMMGRKSILKSRVKLELIMNGNGTFL